MPTFVNLSLKKLVANSSCPRCNGEAESINHLVREFPVSKMVWSNLMFGQIEDKPDLGFFDWLTWIFT